MRGLRGLGVSQCSGVTGEALGQLLPSLPACTRLTLNCLHLTDDHMDMLVKVLPHVTPSGFCVQISQPATQLLVHRLSGCYMLTAFGQDCVCGMVKSQAACCPLFPKQACKDGCEGAACLKTHWASAQQRFGKFCMFYNTGKIAFACLKTYWVSAEQKFGKSCMCYTTDKFAAAWCLFTSSNPSKHLCCMHKTDCALHVCNFKHTQHGPAAKVKPVAFSACSPFLQRHYLYPPCHPSTASLCS